MKFSDLDKAKQNPAQVEILDLEGQWVETADLADFPKLHLLRLSNCDFVLSAGVKLPQLEDLLIVNRAARTHRQLSFLALVFPDLLSLHLEYVKNSVEIGEHVSAFRQLQKLIINQGELSDICFVAKLPKSFKHLDIGANNLTEIPDTIGKLKNLESLRAPSNLLEKISPKLAKLVKLRNLYLGSNNLTRLPRLSKSDNLFSVELSNNQFKNIPKFLFKCRQLHELFISNNPLHKLPAEICEMPRLRIFDAASCKLKALPRKFGRLQSLRSLKLSENLFQNFPKSICEIEHLERLNFNNNQIKRLPTSIKKLQHLRFLDFEGNCLMSLPSVISELSKLYKVNLERNQFQELPRIVMVMEATQFKGLPGKKFLEEYRRAQSEYYALAKQTHFTAYDILVGQEKTKISLQILAELTCVAIPAVRRKGQTKLVRKIRNGKKTIQLNEGHKVFFVGQQSFDCQSIITSELNVLQEIETTDIVVVGKKIQRADLKLLSAYSDKLLTEREFFQQYLVLFLPYLLSPENEETKANLIELFQSEASENKLIAISAMTGGGVPQEVKTDLICLGVSAQQRVEFEQIQQLCEMYLTDAELIVAEYFWGFWIGQYSPPQGSSKRRLEELCQATDLDYRDFYAHYVARKKSSKLPF